MWNRLHRDEGGSEGLEKLLIVAAIVLPLLGLLIVYRDNIGNWLRNSWNAIIGPGQAPLNQGNAIP
jgi:Flp pilus assembly pilin Flp